METATRNLTDQEVIEYRNGWQAGFEAGRRERITNDYRTTSDAARDLGISRSLVGRRAADHNVGVVIGHTNGGATRVFSPEDFETLKQVIASYQRVKK